MEGDLDRSHRMAFWNPELWLAITVKVNDLDLHAFFSMLLHSSWIGNKNRQVAQ